MVQWETASHNEWKRLTTNQNKWQWVVILGNLPFFLVTEEPTTMYPKENSLNI